MRTWASLARLASSIRKLGLLVLTLGVVLSSVLAAGTTGSSSRVGDYNGTEHVHRAQPIGSVLTALSVLQTGAALGVARLAA